FFGENLIVADPEVITEMAVEVGMDRDEVASVLGSDAFAHEVRQDEYAAQALGLNAVPFILINKKYDIPGAVDARDMARIVLRAYDEEEAESAAPGMVCRPDGCHPADDN
ncbi:MAG: DsbA family protein, partial [Candidatus Methanomethylophilus sp.]|nr:DsbA family protein [Methanomethylophilus sp.]